VRVNPQSQAVKADYKRLLEPYKFKPWVFPEGFCLIVDTREQHSPLFLDKPPKGLMVMRDTLHDGDYAIRGVPGFCVEKKYTGDIYPYVSSEREKTIRKMQRFKAISDAGGWVGLLIDNKESDIFKWQDYTKVSPEVVRGALLSFSIRYRVHVYFASDKHKAERFIIDNALKYYKIVKGIK